MKKIILLLVVLICLSITGLSISKCKNNTTDYPDFISEHSISRSATYRYRSISDEGFNNFYVSEDAPDFEISNFEDGVCINRYNGNEEIVKIPETIGGKPVVKLGLYCIHVSYIIDEICEFLEYSCPFMNEYLYSYLVKSEENYTLTEDKAKYYTYQEDEEDIAWIGIENVHLVKKIIIPKTVKYIGNVDSYTVTFEVDKENPNFSSIKGSLCSKDGTELYRCKYDDKTVKIPEGIVTVYNGALPKKKVYIPASVENFYNYDTFISCVVNKNNKVYSSSKDGALLTKDGKELIAVNDVYEWCYDYPDFAPDEEDYEKSWLANS